MKNLDRLSKVLLGSLVIGVWCLVMQSWFAATPAEAADEKVQAPIRTRGLIIVDEKGRERIIMGAPVPDPPHLGKRINPAHGMIILDDRGYERFGVGLMDETGQMAMGFDAPIDPANPTKNPERLHLIADGKGGAMIRFLNRQTGVPGWIRLGDDDKLYFEFIDVQPDKNKVTRRQLSIDGEKMVEQPFKQ
ncbi:MAG: hypothetical protein QUS14_04125 [Pyrinomonadaceae bacterium]|nr:hypothetical protein [Pyrinomonadaceae bacterium]